MAGDMRRGHDQLTQPDLEQLIAAEEQAAQMLREMFRSRNQAERAMVHSELDELDQTLDLLAAGDRRLAKAQDSLHGTGDQEVTANDAGGQRSNETFQQVTDDATTDGFRPDSSGCPSSSIRTVGK